MRGCASCSKIQVIAGAWPDCHQGKPPSVRQPGGRGRGKLEALASSRWGEPLLLIPGVARFLGSKEKQEIGILCDFFLSVANYF